MESDPFPQAICNATRISNKLTLSKDIRVPQDGKRHDFLNLDEPLLPQIWSGGFSKDFYLDQIHRPRYIPSGESAPLMPYEFLEPLSKTVWWVVPLTWLPLVLLGTVHGLMNVEPLPLAISYWAFGLFLWTFVEYTLHRFLFHIERGLPDNRVCIAAHFLLHGVHHFLPMDKYRLVMPPTLFILLAIPFWKLMHVVFFYDRHAAVTVFTGGLLGYVHYDLTHYFLHHKKVPKSYQSLKRHHLQHHFASFGNSFGVTSQFWDWVFGTESNPVHRSRQATVSAVNKRE